MVSIPTLLSAFAMILVVSHPVRRRMLRAIHDSDDGLSLSQIAWDFDVPLATARYHANVLCGLGAAESTRPEPGAEQGECSYSATIEGDTELELLLEETREADEAAGGVGEDGQ